MTIKNNLILFFGLCFGLILTLNSFDDNLEMFLDLFKLFSNSLNKSSVVFPSTFELNTPLGFIFGLLLLIGEFSF